MLKQIVLLFASCLILIGMTQNAAADVVCPPNSQRSVNAQTGEVICIVTPQGMEAAARAQAEIQDASRQLHEKEIRISDIEESIKSSGLLLEGGLGYTLLAAFQMHLKLGYSFSEVLNGISLGLFTDVDLGLGIPDAIIWSAGPMIHVNGSRFRGTLGFGLGVFTIWDREFEPDDDYYDENYDRKKFNYFTFKPQVQCDWFISRHFYMGFGMDFPLVFSRVDKSDGVGMWYNVYLQVGYKF